MIDPAYTTGILLALGGAVANAISYLAIRVGTTKGKAYDAVIVVMLVNIALLAPAAALFYYPEYALTRRSVIAFLAAGVFGTMFGRVFSYLGVDRLGASRAAPIFSTNALVASILGVILLGERLTLFHGVGIVVVVVGAAGISWETTQENPDNLSRRELLLGIVFPVCAAFAYGIDPIFARVGLEEGTPAAVGLVIKTLGALLGFTLYLTARRQLPPIALSRSKNARWFILGGIANTLFLFGYYSALELVPVNVATPIIISYTFWIVVLSALFVPEHIERITWRLVAAALLVVCGLVLITAFA